MTPLSQIPASLIPALRIFEAEMRAHVEYFESFDRQTLQARLQEDDFRTNLLHRFHTIKGGAGFFSLEEIRKSSGKAEKLLQNSTSSSPDKLTDTIVLCVRELKQALAELSKIAG